MTCEKCDERYALMRDDFEMANGTKLPPLADGGIKHFIEFYHKNNHHVMNALKEFKEYRLNAGTNVPPDRCLGES
jgi:hypothetical protein